MNITLTETTVDLALDGIPTTEAIASLPSGTEIRDANGGVSAFKLHDSADEWVCLTTEAWNPGPSTTVRKLLAAEAIAPYTAHVPIAVEPESAVGGVEAPAADPVAIANGWASTAAQQRHDLWNVRPLGELAELSATLLDGQRTVYAEAEKLREAAERIASTREALRDQLLAAHASPAVRDTDDEPAPRTPSERRLAGVDIIRDGLGHFG